jgi:hypothetical protein
LFNWQNLARKTKLAYPCQRVELPRWAQLSVLFNDVVEMLELADLDICMVDGVVAYDLPFGGQFSLPGQIHSIKKFATEAIGADRPLRSTRRQK